jgi:two-component sensor histidine kinase
MPAGTAPSGNNNNNNHELASMVSGGRTLLDYLLEKRDASHNIAVTVGVVMLAVALQWALRPMLPVLLPYITGWSAVLIVAMLCGTSYAIATLAALALFGWAITPEPSWHALVNVLAFLLFSAANIWIIHHLSATAVEQHILAREINHRSKNLLAVVQAIAGRSLDPEARGAFLARLQALSRSDSQLTASGTNEASLLNIIDAALAPFTTTHVTVSVPEGLHCCSRSGLLLGLLFHELATNSAKYGAMRADGLDASIWVEGYIEAGKLTLSWEEHDTVVVQTMGKPGFGLTLVRMVARAAGGSAQTEMREHGFWCQLSNMSLSFLKEHR